MTDRLSHGPIDTLRTATKTKGCNRLQILKRLQLRGRKALAHEREVLVLDAATVIGDLQALETALL